jgi:hypothetical protein
MLFAGCSFCRNTVPLWCAGGFPPHPPLAVEASPMGPYCGYCGPLQPVFRCGMCGSVQYLLLLGMGPPPTPAFGNAQLVAPVVQAPEAASKGQVRSLIVECVKAFAGPAGKEFGHSMGVWMASQ